MSGTAYRKLRFGPFELSIGERVLRRDGEVLPLGDRALDILIHLAERPGEVIGKKELIDQVWSDVVVEEGSLRVHVAAIRKALADGLFGSRYVANVQGRGYSFVGAVVSFEDSVAGGIDRPRYQVRLPLRSKMIGREWVINEVGDRLRRDRFVSLLGPGGIGKTTVAVAVGHAMLEEFAGQVHFVDLGSLSDPRHVAFAVGSSLGIALQLKDAGSGLVEFVRSRKLLIILDSCEHLIEAVAALAERLFQEADQVHLLATSRELLRVEGEYCYRVLPLDCPPDSTKHTANAVLRYPAVQLFAERVAAKGGSFVPTDAEVASVAEICRRLDGVPLAIELAAGRVAALGVRNAVSSLASRLDVLKLGRRTAVPRHRTIKATLDWSYDLLSEAEKIVFRRIGSFVGHFSLEGARYVAGEHASSGGAIFDAIAGLVEKSLLATRIDEKEAQYRLLDTTRAYAFEKLEEQAELHEVLVRHAEFVTENLEAQRDAMETMSRAERVACYSNQLGNVRAALEWSFGPKGNDEIATRLAAVSTQLFLELSLLIECQAWAERAIGRLGTQHKNSRREMEVYGSLSLALMHTEGSSERVREAFSQALEIAVAQRDLAYELRLLSGLFLYSRWTLDIGGSLEIAARGKKVAEKTQDPDDMALAESMLGAAYHLAGNHLIAQKHFETGLSYSAFGSRFSTGRHLFHHTSLLAVGMARSLLYRGVLDGARDYARLAVEEGENSGHPVTLYRSLSLVLPVYLALADYERSDRYIRQLTDLASFHALRPYGAVATGLRGQWLLHQNAPHQAIPLLKRALEGLQAQRHEMLSMEFVCDLAAGLIADGDHEPALAMTLNAIELQQRGGKFLYMPALFRMKGIVLASRSADDYPESERSLLEAIDWAKRQSAALFELRAATDLAELLLRQKRVGEAHEHLRSALSRIPTGIEFPAYERAQRIFDRFKSGAEEAG